jgi:hypothetical protein
MMILWKCKESKPVKLNHFLLLKKEEGKQVGTWKRLSELYVVVMLIVMGWDARSWQRSIPFFCLGP